MQEEILDIINSWDEKSLATLYRHFYRVAVSYAYKLVGEQMVAEDVVQDVFLSLWERKKQFNTLSHLRAFIIQCIHNRSVDKIRSAKSSTNREQEVFAMSDKLEIMDEGEVMREQVYQNLLVAIDALPARQRELFLMLMEGKKNAEIAEALNVSLNTVKTQRRRGMDSLRKTLNPKSLTLLYAVLTLS